MQVDSLVAAAGAWGRFAISGALLIVALCVLWLLERGLRRWLKLGASVDATRELRWPIRAVVLMLALVSALQIAPGRIRQFYPLSVVMKMAMVIALSSLANGMLSTSLRLWNRGSLSESTRLLIGTLLRVGLIALSGLILLDTAGISITPLLASLGVGSVAVALALQDTLSNFFSGIYLLIDKPIRIGDYVELEAGRSGTVSEIGWRSTHIRLPSNNVVVIPNSKLSSSVLTNFNMPDEQTTFTVRLSLHYDCDLDKAESLIREIATAVNVSIPGGVPEVAPGVAFEAITEDRVEVSIAIRARRQADAGPLRHELIKRLLRRLPEGGIALPTPRQRIRVSEAEHPPAPQTPPDTF